MLCVLLKQHGCCCPCCLEEKLLLLYATCFNWRPFACLCFKFSLKFIFQYSPSLFVPVCFLSSSPVVAVAAAINFLFYSLLFVCICRSVCCLCYLSLHVSIAITTVALLVYWWFLPLCYALLHYVQCTSIAMILHFNSFIIF